MELMHAYYVMTLKSDASVIFSLGHRMSPVIYLNVLLFLF